MVNFIVEHGMTLWLLICLFVLGSIVGSFLNVGIARLPFEKSVIWPGSRCGNCFQPIRIWNNIPLLSYWLLRGRCRNCKMPFSMRYFFVELLVAVGFVAIFYFEIIRNIHHMPEFDSAARNLKHYLFSSQNLKLLWFFLHRAILFSLLVVAAFSDLQNRSIPLSITLAGTIVGIALATAFPWPWPNSVASAMPAPNQQLGTDEWWMLQGDQMQKQGLYPWPVWGPLPNWLPPGSWRLGLATGLVGALVGSFMLRAVKFLFEKGLGREALGLGDADLMMMVGAFLGWQPVVIAFLVGGVVSLLFALPSLLVRGENEIPFGPGLATGALLTWLFWSWIGPLVQVILFYPTILGMFVVGCAGVMLVLSFLMGRINPSKGPPEPKAGHG
jgi:leader peptidase (prepilin peptidase)/N-methyltransferase